VYSLHHGLSVLMRTKAGMEAATLLPITGRLCLPQLSDLLDRLSCYFCRCKRGPVCP
jgi:hypothetical protein